MLRDRGLKILIPSKTPSCIPTPGLLLFETKRAQETRIMETQKKLQIKPHKQLVTFFSDTALATRGFRPAITAKDAQNLKRVLDLNILDVSRMEQLMLYFLADRNYKNLGPSLSTIFSGTILNSLRNAALNREKFYKELDQYTTRYILKQQPKPKPVQIIYDEYEAQPVGTGAVSMAVLLGRLSNQLKLDRSNAPRAPVREAERSSSSKPLSLFNNTN